ncbi:MAG: T9SS type A sorting domain-containing protein [Bacteroidetes bacterium]|nr:T9SS type A sorting domain-containing protein [Bacteroidota bacterium]
MKTITLHPLLTCMLVSFMLLPWLTSAQTNSPVNLKATNGQKGFYSATIKQSIPLPEKKESVTAHHDNVYLGALSNLQTEDQIMPSPGENSREPKAPFLDGDNIATAFSIATLPFVTNGTTCGYTNDYDEACPYIGSGAPDVVYKYYATSSVTINIALCNSEYDTKLYVYDNINTPGAPYACNDDYCGTDNYKSKISNLNLLAGHWYYIVVDGYGSICGNYQLDVIPSVICPSGGIPENEPQIQDQGADVTNGGCNYSPFLFSPIMLGQTICGHSNTYLTGTSNTRDTDWYLLDLSASADSTQITWDVVADFNLFIAIVQDGPTQCTDYVVLSEVAATAGNHANLIARIGPGKYYLFVSPNQWAGYPPNSSTYSYTAKLMGGTIPANNLCANATWINEVGALPFNTTNATNDGPSVPCGSTDPDLNIWYNYTATFTGEAVVSLCGSSYDTRLNIFNGVGCTPLAPLLFCSDDFCGLQSQITFNVISGSIYKILVGGFSSTAFGPGYLTIKPTCLTECPPDATPENEPMIPDDGADVTNGGCNYTPFNYTPVVLGQTYCGMINTFLDAGIESRDLDWYRLDLSAATDSTLLTYDVYTSFNAMAFIIDAMAEDCLWYTMPDLKYPIPCKHTTLTARVKPGIYYLVVTTNGFTGLPAAAGPYLYLAKLTGVTIPSNDYCQNAKAISEVTNLPFNTTAALHDETGTCLASSASRNIWYAYYPNCTGTATISLCGSFYDTKMAVYEGAGCGPRGALLGCSDDYCGLASSLSVPVIYGHAYLIEIGGFNPLAYGMGLLTIQCSQTLPMNLDLQDITINQGQSPCYNAAGTITVGGFGHTFTIINGASVTMIAGDYIRYLPGTTVRHGGYLHGYIRPNGPWCDPPVKGAVVVDETGETKETIFEPTSSTSFFKVYPNPTNGSFTLEFTGTSEPAEVNVEIYGMHGDKILTTHLTGERKHLLNIENGAKGIYILRVLTASETGSVKLIKN